MFSIILELDKGEQKVEAETIDEIKKVEDVKLEIKNNNEVKSSNIGLEAVKSSIESNKEIDTIAKKTKHNYSNEEFNEKNRGIEIIRMNDSYQMCTKKEYYEYIYPILDKRSKPNLSNAALEILAKFVGFHLFYIWVSLVNLLNCYIQTF